MKAIVLGVTLLGACATDDVDGCTNPKGLYRATVMWKDSTCTTPAATIQFLIDQEFSYDREWQIEFMPWNTKGELFSLGGPNGCYELEFHTDVAGSISATEHFDGWLLFFDGELPTGELAGGGFREVTGSTPCRGQFTLGYVVKEE